MPIVGNNYFAFTKMVLLQSKIYLQETILPTICMEVFSNRLERKFVSHPINFILHWIAITQKRYLLSFTKYIIIYQHIPITSDITSSTTNHLIPNLVWIVDICSLAYQQLHQVQVPVCCRIVQRSPILDCSAINQICRET